MRRIFLIGITTGVCLEWLREMNPQFSWIAFALWLYGNLLALGAIKSRSALATGMMLLSTIGLVMAYPKLTAILTEVSDPLAGYIIPIQVVLGMLYVYLRVESKSNNHLDMVICGILTGVVMKWFHSYGNNELGIAIALFAIGSVILIFESKRAIKSTIVALVLTLGSIPYLDTVSRVPNSFVGLVPVILGIITEWASGIKPIGGKTLQVFLILLLEKIQERVNPRKPTTISNEEATEVEGEG